MSTFAYKHMELTEPYDDFDTNTVRKLNLRDFVCVICTCA